MKITFNLDTTLKYVQFWNSLFNLTSKELEVLVNFITIAEDESDLCSKLNKKSVATFMNIKDSNTLNNYIKRLKDKGALIYKNKKYGLHKLLLNKADVNVRVVRG
jgi:hypothetical protein